MKRTCKQCGKEFVLSQSEINFYKSKNLSIPKRCKECRDANKQVRGNDKLGDTKQISYQNNHSNNNMNQSSSALTKLLIIAGIVLLAIFGAWSHFSGDNNKNADNAYSSSVSSGVSFRNVDLLNEHYQKHGVEMGFSSATAYENAARNVVNNSNTLHKTEAEDGDDVYYLESTNEFVIVSTDGYIRTYFKPNDGIDYYNRQ